MFQVLESRMIVPNIHQMTLLAPEVARTAEPGNFVILRVEEDGERIPLTISDWDADKGTVTVVFMNIGMTTRKLGWVHEGESLPTVVGPLGNSIPIEKAGTVVCVGGCYGIASIYPIARAFKAAGNRVVTIIEARSSFLFFWQEKLKGVSDRLVYITRDGTRGVRGHITRLPDILKALDEPVDRVIINGCNYLMMRGSEATRPLGIGTTVSLNTLMIDGTGMCGVCRVTVDGKTRFACVDGPHFDGHQVDWEELAQRRKAYAREEIAPLRSSGIGD